MQPFDRVQQLHQIFTAHRRPVSIRKLYEYMECSDKTIKCTIDTLRDNRQAPLVYSSEEKGWCYDNKTEKSFPLPGLWLTADELLSLLAFTFIFNDLGDGVLYDELSTTARDIDAQQWHPEQNGSRREMNAC